MPRVAGSVYVVFVNANATCALFDRTRPSASNASGTPSPPLRFTYGSAPVLLTTIGPLNPVRVPADMSNTPWPPPPLHTSVPVPVRVAPRVSERLSDGAYEIVNRPPAPIWQLPIRMFSQFPMPSSKRHSVFQRKRRTVPLWLPKRTVLPVEYRRNDR
ncbi:MAG: hypothetical protein IJL17_11950 [Kiritimatiellae bacterium]|nr:hypothetical protein [Kiritimatiellia bacterium]